MTTRRAAFGGTCLFVLLMAPLATFAEEKLGKETGRSSFYEFNATTSGFLGSCLLEIDGQPAACFGPSAGSLHQKDADRPEVAICRLPLRAISP